MRKKIANGELRVLRWPADGPCPVEKGQRFKVMGIVIQIHSIERRITAGRPVEWHASYVRHEPDRVYLVRQAPPAQATHEKPEDVTLDMAERARRDGNYTSSRVAALPMEPESVGPDWKDKEAPQKELKRRKDRLEMKKEDEVRKISRRLKLDTARVIQETFARGENIDYLLEDLYARLAQQTEENKRAA